MNYTVAKLPTCFFFSTYLCYSPTCTPAQLSLLSEAIAKYSAFLREKKKTKTWAIGICRVAVNYETQKDKKKKKNCGWTTCVISVLFSSLMTYRKEGLVLTSEQDGWSDEKMRSRQRETSDRQTRSRHTDMRQRRWDVLTEGASGNEIRWHLCCIVVTHVLDFLQNITASTVLKFILEHPATSDDHLRFTSCGLVRVEVGFMCHSGSLYSQVTKTHSVGRSAIFNCFHSQIRSTRLLNRSANPPFCPVANVPPRIKTSGRECRRKPLTPLLVTLPPRPLQFSCSSKSSRWEARPGGRWWTHTSWPRRRWRPSLWWLHTQQTRRLEQQNVDIAI